MCMYVYIYIYMCIYIYIERERDTHGAHDDDALLLFVVYVLLTNTLVA